MPEEVAPRRLWKRLAWSLAGAVLVALAGLVLLLGPESDLGYVCAKCCKARRSRGKRLALVHFQVCVSHHEEETTLSRFLNSSGIVGKHEHDWHLMGGTDIVCVDGVASCLGPLMGSEVAVRFLRALHRHVGVDAARRWTVLLIDTGTHSSQLRALLEKESLPARAYEDGELFRAWWKEHAKSMEKAVAGSPRLFSR